jgi:GLPGLI family protein
MKCIYLFFFFLITNTANTQTTFITSGKISFERKITQYTLNESFQSEKDMASGWSEEFKKIFPKIITDNYVMDFNTSKTYYRLAKENPDNKYMVYGFKPSETDFTLQYLNDELTIMKKSLFENEYFIKDSITKYEWKITGELRDIAGFECKKAITKICDSVVVVAFYTDQILVKGGPESFNGLPGMILGLAIPRLSETIYATKLELTSSEIPIPAQGKSKLVKRDQITFDLKKGLEQWGKSGKAIVWVNNL